MRKNCVDAILTGLQIIGWKIWKSRRSKLEDMGQSKWLINRDHVSKLPHGLKDPSMNPIPCHDLDQQLDSTVADLAADEEYRATKTVSGICDLRAYSRSRRVRRPRGARGPRESMPRLNTNRPCFRSRRLSRKKCRVLQRLLDHIWGEGGLCGEWLSIARGLLLNDQVNRHHGKGVREMAFGMLDKTL